MHLRDRGCVPYAPYAPCLSTPLRRTDGQTDRQMTCDRNTALCTKVHRAVKIKSWQLFNLGYEIGKKIHGKHTTEFNSCYETLFTKYMVTEKEKCRKSTRIHKGQ